MLQELKPESAGLVFDAVKKRGLEASSGSTDFGGLFLGFSFFLIASALLLVGLLFRLNTERRAGELGLLLATGYRRSTIRGLLLGEGALLALAGGALGLAGAVLYAWLMLDLLPGLDRSFLRLHAGNPTSYLIGYVGSLFVSLLVVFWAVRVLGKVSPRALLAGSGTEEAPTPNRPESLYSWLFRAISCFLALALLPVGVFVHNQEAKAGSFFTIGLLLLTAGLSTVWSWMRHARHGAVNGAGISAICRLGLRNAARNPSRSILTTGLLASAVFLIVAVESFHREAGQDFLNRDSGSGGFAYLAESDLPIFQDLNNAASLDELNIPKNDRDAFAALDIFPFRVRAGDDASCLNLYQPTRPRLIGASKRLIERGGFHFKETEAQSKEDRANSWRLLQKSYAEGVVPVFGEANTVEWILHSGLGKEITITGEQGNPIRLRIVGLLQDSVFQSELVMSEENFTRLFPRQEGFPLFLVDSSKAPKASVKPLLETALADYGFTVTSTAQRLEAYLAMENAYLSTFQSLGGLGLILGALGLAVVLMRNVLERRKELALLQAIGFRKSALGWLVLAENVFLLILGLVTGVFAALIAVAPHVIEVHGNVPWLRLAGPIALVLVVGLLAGMTAMKGTLRGSLIPALRGG